MLKQVPPLPSGGVGGVFPPQLSPQQMAMLGSIYPPHIQLQLVRPTSSATNKGLPKTKAIFDHETHTGSLFALMEYSHLHKVGLTLNPDGVASPPQVGVKPDGVTSPPQGVVNP